MLKKANPLIKTTLFQELIGNTIIILSLVYFAMNAFTFVKQNLSFFMLLTNISSIISPIIGASIRYHFMKPIINCHKKLKDGEDINDYRDIVDNLEYHLRELYELNGKLASIVLPVKQMYKEIIDDITVANGGTLFEVTA